jgi:hypothetical protein
MANMGHQSWKAMVRFAFALIAKQEYNTSNFLVKRRE